LCVAHQQTSVISGHRKHRILDFCGWPYLLTTSPKGPLLFTIEWWGTLTATINVQTNQHGM